VLETSAPALIERSSFVLRANPHCCSGIERTAKTARRKRIRISSAVRSTQCVSTSDRIIRSRHTTRSIGTTRARDRRCLAEAVQLNAAPDGQPRRRRAECDTFRVRSAPGHLDRRYVVADTDDFKPRDLANMNIAAADETSSGSVTSAQLHADADGAAIRAKIRRVPAIFIRHLTAGRSREDHDPGNSSLEHAVAFLTSACSRTKRVSFAKEELSYSEDAALPAAAPD
jgi:hypothetical protein